MPDDKGRILLAIARSSIAKTLGQTFEANEDASWLQEKAACFVTLMQRGNLRGCIGTLNAYRTLLDDVKRNANAAAFNDTRFSPLTREELDITDIEISLLSPMRALNFSSEQEALTKLRPGIDGVVFEYNHYRSTFLPQVWQQLPDSEDFIAHLKTKAGLASDFWSDEIKLSIYTVEKWKERDFMTSSEEKVI